MHILYFLILYEYILMRELERATLCYSNNPEMTIAGLTTLFYFYIYKVCSCLFYTHEYFLMTELERVIAPKVLYLYRLFAAV